MPAFRFRYTQNRQGPNGQPPLPGGPNYVPFPVREMDCGLPGTVSATSILALRFPVAAGVNVTVMWQLAPAASVAGKTGHVLVWAKSPGSAPAILMLAMPSGVPLGLPITIVCALLLVPTGSFPNAAALGKTEITGRLSSTDTVSEVKLGTARSAPPSPFKSAAANSSG